MKNDHHHISRCPSHIPIWFISLRSNHLSKRHGKKEKEMKLQIEIVKENNDGSADALVHFDKEALGMLIEKGVISILRQYIEQEKKAKKEKK